MATLELNPTDVEVFLGAPTGFRERKFAVDFLTGNLYYTDPNTGVWTVVPSSGIVGPAGSASLNFGSIADGAIAALTFTVTGAVVGDKLACSFPSGLNAGLIGMMFVSAADTVTVRLANLSGAAIDPAAMTFAARVIY